MSLAGLREVRQRLVDQRKRRGVRYPLAPMLAMAVLAKLAGYSRLEALTDWAKLHATELAQVFQLSRATMPHQTTWSRLFAHAVEITARETVVGAFLASQIATSELPAPGSIVLMVDGKTLRGTIPLGHDRGTHVVAAYRPDHGLVLAQQAVDAKANEAALNNVVVGLVLHAGQRNLAAAQRHFSYQFDHALARGHT